jgi:hypothetical protein
MPSFSTEVEIDFEVFCGNCGKGICNKADTRKSHRRWANQITVEPCDCMTERIKELEHEVEYLTEQLN